MISVLYHILFFLFILVGHASGQLKVTKSWQLPVELRNVSAVEYMSPGRFAFLSDEVGSIFIYNLFTSKIEKEISFGPPGDYEGLVLIKTRAYIACADGRVLEVRNYTADSVEVTEYGTHLTVEEHVSGLCYDSRNNRLLVCIRGSEDANQQFKAVYAFQLREKKMLVKPALKIDLTNSVFRDLHQKRVQTIFQPTDIDINPTNGIIYLIDGNRSQLLRMRMSESIWDLSEFDNEKINQPEGITFTPSGDVFVASKGLRNEPGILLQIRIK